MPALRRGLQLHLAGEVATNVANQASSERTGKRTQLFSLLFIIVLLLLIFRSLLAPVITLLPAGLSLLVSMRLIGELGAHGLKISEITELLLIILMLGAGTDYGLFLVFRVREELRRRARRHGRGRARARAGRRVDHRLGRDRDPRAADAAARELRHLPATSGSRSRSASAIILLRRAHAAAGAAGDLRPCRLLAHARSRRATSARACGDGSPRRLVSRPGVTLDRRRRALRRARARRRSAITRAASAARPSAPPGTDAAAGKRARRARTSRSRAPTRPT